jgi:hypothetical protein
MKISDAAATPRAAGIARPRDPTVYAAHHNTMGTLLTVRR